MRTFVVAGSVLGRRRHALSFNFGGAVQRLLGSSSTTPYAPWPLGSTSRAACGDHEPRRPPLPAPSPRLALDLAPGPIPILVIAELLVGQSLRRPRLWWSRPMPADVCSMFARTPGYAPAPSGIRSESRIPETGQNGSSRHVLSLPGSISKRINEQRSGLLIRGFGVQVPGGAPGLTWGFTTPGPFFRVRFVHMFAPCLLGRTDPAIRGLSRTARPTPRRRSGVTRPMV
jgi:hypothetical protein